MSGNQNLNKSVFAGQKSKVMNPNSYALSSSSNSNKKIGSNSKKNVPVGSCGGKSMSTLNKKNWDYRSMNLMENLMPEYLKDIFSQELRLIKEAFFIFIVFEAFPMPTFDIIFKFLLGLPSTTKSENPDP